MANLENHFKDRKPEETIQILNNFFIRNKMQVIKIGEIKSIIGTYSNRYALYFNNKVLVYANGKGETDLYAQASGLAELYERFCILKYYLNLNPYIKNYLNNSNSDNDNNIMNDSYVLEFLKYYLPEINNENINKFLDLYFNNNYDQIEFQRISEPNNKIKKNFSTTVLVTGTTGFAAGNTLEEALVQGSSEFFERLCTTYFLNDANNLNKKFYKLQNIPKKFQEKIKQIEDKDNLKITIYDLSYTYNLPVILLLYNDPTNHTYFFQFGSAPVFDIAIERCITEYYQGLPKTELLNRKFYLNNEIDVEYLYVQQGINSKCFTTCLPLCLIANSEFIDSYNKNIFLVDDTYSNNILLNHISFIEKINNLNLYFSNISLCKEMFTVYVISKDFINRTAFAYFLKFNRYTKKEKEIYLDLWIFIKKIYNKIINIDINQIENEQINDYLNYIISQLKRLSRNEKINFDQIISHFLSYNYTNIFRPYGLLFQLGHEAQGRDNELLLFEIFKDNFDIKNFNNNLIIMQRFQVYIYLKKLLEQNYSQELCKKFLEFLNFSDIELQNINIEKIDKYFLIKYVYCQTIQNIYNSKEFKDYIYMLTSLE